MKMEYNLGNVPAADTTRPSDRRKVRAEVLRSRRNQRAIICEQGPSAIFGPFQSRKNGAPDVPAYEDIIEDKKVARKLRNRASALASRNKRTEEIEMLTYRLELMTEEAKRLQTRLSRYEDTDTKQDVVETNIQIRRKRNHCFITEPAVF